MSRTRARKGVWLNILINHVMGGHSPPPWRVAAAVLTSTRRYKSRPLKGAELFALAKDTMFEGLIQHVLVHDAFPTDARHNSKIRREDIAPWAAEQLGIQ